MLPLKYDGALLAQLSPDDCEVRRLCGDPPDDRYAQHARTLEKWFNTLGGTEHQYKRLTSPQSEQFESGRWELIAGRFFAGRNYSIKFDPRVPSGIRGTPDKTPDLSVDNGDLHYLVEVFNLNPSNNTVEEEKYLAQLSAELTERLSFETGSVSVQLMRMEAFATCPKSDSVDFLVGQLQPWLDIGHSEPVQVNRGTMPFSACWMPSDQPRVLVSPLRKAIGDAQRLQSKLGEKLASYGNIEETLVLFVAADHWTITMRGMITAMFGVEQFSFDANDPDNVELQSLRYNGDGSLVEGGIVGYPATKIIAGCIFARRTMFNDTGSLNIEITYIHNPYSERRLPNDTFAPFAELQVDGSMMTWVRKGGHPAVILD